jgi:hypothetical protein
LPLDNTYSVFQVNCPYSLEMGVACCVFSADHDNSMFTMWALHVVRGAMRALWLAYDEGSLVPRPSSLVGGGKPGNKATMRALCMWLAFSCIIC